MPNCKSTTDRLFTFCHIILKAHFSVCKMKGRKRSAFQINLSLPLLRQPRNQDPRVSGFSTLYPPLRHCVLVNFHQDEMVSTPKQTWKFDYTQNANQGKVAQGRPRWFCHLQDSMEPLARDGATSSQNTSNSWEQHCWMPLT